MDKKRNTGGMGFLSTLTIVFIVLKLCSVINWPWLWVLAPMWISIALMFVIALVAAIATVLK